MQYQKTALLLVIFLSSTKFLSYKLITFLNIYLIYLIVLFLLHHFWCTKYYEHYIAFCMSKIVSLWSIIQFVQRATVLELIWQVNSKWTKNYFKLPIGLQQLQPLPSKILKVNFCAEFKGFNIHHFIYSTWFKLLTHLTGENF